MSLSALAQKYELLPQQVTNWKGELLNGEVLSTKKIYIHPPKDEIDLYRKLEEYLYYYNNE